LQKRWWSLGKENGMMPLGPVLVGLWTLGFDAL
jgi:hypothetical protein